MTDSEAIELYPDIYPDTLAMACLHGSPVDFTYPPKTKNGGIAASAFYSAINSDSAEPSRRMREQGVDEAGLRGEMAA
jgi:hypothetical protein